MPFNREFIKSVIPDVIFLGSEFPSDACFSIDSRTIQKGEIFVALRGAHVDGHAFVDQALTRGAAGLIINHQNKALIDALDKSILNNCAIAYVPDTYSALENLAHAWRMQFNYPVIGITGSVGKTTTKEMIVSMIRMSGKNCLASQGNQNTVLGCALSILKMRHDHSAAIFEMGISKRGEMAKLAGLVLPTTGVITSIGHSHMEGLGSLMDVAAEKRTIFKYFKEDNIGIINGDVAVLSSVSYPHPIIKFGTKMTNQIQARKIQVHQKHIDFILKMYRDRYHITSQTNHVGFIMNGLAVAAVGHILGISREIICKNFQLPPEVPSRFQMRPIKNQKGMVIDDCYNASPESMKAALLAFEKIESKGKKIAVLGDMLELGVNAPFWHRQLGRFLRKVGSLNHVVFVGNNVKWAQKTIPPFMSYEITPTWQEAINAVNKILDNNTVVLVKGSNSVGLKNLVAQITE